MLAEEIFYTRALSDSELSSLHGYLQTRLTTPPEAPGEQGAPVQFISETPGVLLVDSEAGALLELPKHGPVFASNSDLLLWAAAHLNAQLVYNDLGEVIDATGSVTQAGRFFYVDDTTFATVEVEDVVEALLGGRSGIVTVAGQKYCLREDGCEAGMAPHAPPTEERRCNTDGTYCIKATSFKRNLIIYKSWGTKLEQKNGGYHEDWKFCWKLFIPWACKKKSGQNELSLRSSYQLESSSAHGCGNQIDPQNPRPECTPWSTQRETSKRNTEKIKLREFSFFLGASYNLDNGSVEPGGSADMLVEGVCSTGTGRDPRDSSKSARTVTSKGSIDFICPDPFYQ